jgi:hypothetical protein
MASTTFVDNSAPAVAAAWLNDVNAWTYSGTFAGTQMKLPNGTAGAPSLSFTNSPTTGIYRPFADQIFFTSSGVDIFRMLSGAITMRGDMYFAWESGAINSTADLKLVRDAAATLALRDSTNAQTFRLYNTFTDVNNYERLNISWSANLAQILTSAAGTGTERALKLGTTSSASITLQNATNSIALTPAGGGNVGMTSDNVVDLGASGANRPRTGYFGTSVVIAGQAYTANGAIASITYVIDGGGSVPSTGVKGDLLIPFACTINSATLQADQSGSAVVDIWKKTYTVSSPPTVTNTITAAALPTLTTAQSSQDATLTGWTTAVAANDMLRFNLNSVTTCTRIVLTLKVTKT